MTDPYILLKTLHILMVAVWLGTDIATFTRMKDASLPIRCRQKMTSVVLMILDVMQTWKYGDMTERYMNLPEGSWIDLSAGVADQSTHIVPRAE